ncbi:hypothetical protein NDU88_002553 [Pleurodeles waltl]|uniref:Uncharacterized protein n=1 Tax=Pleurodeles waltl TaxID=8319 RepID=A0AAV7QA92_PLEWA|nr:hypothetical protein NDU88_002553 [Pleurodeles waltl]
MVRGQGPGTDQRCREDGGPPDRPPGALKFHWGPVRVAGGWETLERGRQPRWTRAWGTGIANKEATGRPAFFRNPLPLSLDEDGEGGNDFDSEDVERLVARFHLSGAKCDNEQEWKKQLNEDPVSVS